MVNFISMPNEMPAFQELSESIITANEKYADIARQRCCGPKWPMLYGSYPKSAVNPRTVHFLLVIILSGSPFNLHVF